MKNLGLLIISFIIAICLTYFVNSKSGMSSTNLIMPVVTSNLPQNKIVIATSKSQVQVTVRGPSYLLNNVSRMGANLNIKFPDDISTSYSTKISPSDLHLPSNLEVLNIEPQELTFTLDNQVTKSIPVVVPRIGTLDERFRLVGFKVEPETIDVTGSELELKGIKRVQTESIDVRNITENVIQDVKLRPIGSFVKPAKDMVKVQILVREVQGTKEFKSLNIEIRNQINKAFDVDFKTADVMISGAKRDVQKLSIDNIKPYILIDEETAESKHAKLQVEVPEGFTIVGVNPKTILLKDKKN